jgi:hypothetical protein
MFDSLGIRNRTDGSAADQITTIDKGALHKRLRIMFGEPAARAVKETAARPAPLIPNNPPAAVMVHRRLGAVQRCILTLQLKLLCSLQRTRTSAGGWCTSSWCKRCTAPGEGGGGAHLLLVSELVCVCTGPLSEDELPNTAPHSYKYCA